MPKKKIKLIPEKTQDIVAKKNAAKWANQRLIDKMVGRNPERDKRQSEEMEEDHKRLEENAKKRNKRYGN